MVEGSFAASRDNRALLSVLLPRMFGFNEHFGLRRDTRVMNRLREVFGVAQLESLRIPLRITATDFHNGEQVVFGDFGIAKDLPAFKTTPIEFTPDKSGEFTFACGMNMLRGKLIVE